MVMVRVPASQPVTIRLTRRIKQTHLCDVPGCQLLQPWLVVTTIYANGRKMTTHLCQGHGVSFMAGLAEVWS